MPRAAIVVSGLMFALAAVPTARAQLTLDVSKITCEQYTGHKITNAQNIAIWLSGYYHGKHGDTTLETQQLIDCECEEAARLLFSQSANVGHECN